MSELGGVRFFCGTLDLVAWLRLEKVNNGDFFFLFQIEFEFNKDLERGSCDISKTDIKRETCVMSCYKTWL